jgi:CO dehydrogenase maturation factor
LPCGLLAQENLENGDFTLKIAVSGKGGVGKTLIAAGLAFSFANKGLKTIAIDADPSPNLALTLGLTPEDAEKILPISENKDLIQTRTSTGYSGVFRLNFTVEDIVREYAVRTPLGVDLIVMGTVKSMGSGCTCPANAVIRAMLQHLIVERDEIVVLDTEAGVEHLGRGTAKHVDTMLIVADANVKSLEIAKHIHELASNAGLKQVFLVGNKVEDENQEEMIRRFAANKDLDILCFVPFDRKVGEAEMHGETPLRNSESVAIQAIEKLRDQLTVKNS